MGVPRSTVSTIWKNRDKYHETAASTSTNPCALQLKGLPSRHDGEHADQVDRGQDTMQDADQYGLRSGYSDVLGDLGWRLVPIPPNS
ncbi:hypothetical protein E2C01_008070 [Portunus trituberculatus]|uniref:HTH psq-type domain-containing protein n=1 Tax=Portunus trituberculatus TaxID=210409 RepID=A0A5B7D2X8_PORTR|nr:hypothetical protein [Portunus trituberculatus]